MSRHLGVQLKTFSVGHKYCQFAGNAYFDKLSLYVIFNKIQQLLSTKNCPLNKYILKCDCDLPMGPTKLYLTGKRRSYKMSRAHHVKHVTFLFIL